jgi:hypothetical protein
MCVRVGFYLRAFAFVSVDANLRIVDMHVENRRPEASVNGLYECVV